MNKLERFIVVCVVFASCGLVMVGFNNVIHTPGGCPFDDGDGSATIRGNLDVIQTTEVDTAGDAYVTIYNSDTDVTTQQYLLRLRYKDDGDPDADFFICEDNNGDEMFSIASNGSLAIGSEINFGATGSQWKDNIELLFGSGYDFAMGYDSGEDTLRIVTSSNIETDANLLFHWNTQSAVMKTSTTVGLQGTTPLHVGEFYFNTDTNELWIATGTAQNDFVRK